MKVEVDLKGEYEFGGELYEPTGEYRPAHSSEKALDCLGVPGVWPKGFAYPLFILRKIELPPRPTPEKLAEMGKRYGKPVEIAEEKPRHVKDGELFVSDTGMPTLQRKRGYISGYYAGRRWILREVAAPEPKFRPFTADDEIVGRVFRYNLSPGWRGSVTQQDLRAVTICSGRVSYSELFSAWLIHAPGTPEDGLPAGVRP